MATHEAKKFHLGDILSVTAGPLVSPRHIEGVYDIMGHLTGQSLFTHQLVIMREECRNELIRQHPWLAGISGEDCTTKNWREWLAGKVTVHGEYHLVSPIVNCEERG